ncbi:MULTISPECIES: IclR family transcriptional regulator [unclassified Meiothermus]|uniref:IclR family transcriptional regulator n=1 Tax=unclassified Meiothermus TaxID=370471 RepID=UPI000D7CB01D|nr:MULTISPECIES: IclR family transcriptional regulator [unclassified Meiothermus]PZA07573.1 IclR family transcriptional regulator [Meiothermus sp. Pnk-1]RYM36789.1 IclR family transcriptional regulator [Meiothermus sp. PNK-Is4]
MDRYVIQAAYKTLQILLVFGEPPHRFTATRIAEMTQMDRGQIFRSLRTLERAGLVRMEEDQHYVLSSVISTLAMAACRIDRSLAELASPYLAELARLTGETAVLGALSGESIILLDLCESKRAVRWASLIGHSFPLHVGGGRATLPYLPKTQWNHLLARLPLLPVYTPRTLSRPEQLLEDMQLTYRQGYSVGDQDYDLETRSVSAPIFDHQGRVIGVLSLAGPAYRLALETIPAYAKTVMDYALQISRQLGYAGLYPNPHAEFALEGGEIA